MAVYDLEEQEQLDEIKTWWKQYGNLVTAIAVAAALASVAWQGWGWWQRTQAAQASAVYNGLQKAASERDAKRSRELAGELIDKFSGTVYAGMGALLSAKVQVDAGDAKTARAQLQWAADNAADAGLKDLARLRLASVMADDKAYDEALAQLAKTPAEPFAPRYAELKGDILVAQGKNEDARKVYQQAVEQLDKQIKSDAASPHRAYRDLVQSKLDALGAAK